MTSLAKTHRILVVDEGYAMCGIGAEVAAAVGELAFDELDAPVGRLQLEPVSHPFSPLLEAEMLPSVEKIVAAARELMAGRIAVSRRPQSGGSAAPAPSPAAGKIAPAEATDAPVGTVPAAPANTEILAGELVTMPHGDLTVTEAKVVQWLKKVGDAVKKGEAIAEVETDKAVMEIEAPRDGKLVQILAPVGGIVKMGGSLGVVS
jgi:2-oxoisovalerate dehydrogenase E1 component